ncbi:phospholipase D family protein [Micromonospora aurantiaca (nom. illeg.)]|uniref:phospholipase D family protein n=1 Tax=Micromonospora aurantiaca (nom. illeg.) TaxID=47850 RepID=UPI0037959015
MQTLLTRATDRVHLIAPFIKLDVFKATLACIPSIVQRIDCVTRWSVTEVAAGVSDPEIIQLTRDDKRLRVRLCHNLHAKLFLADEVGLAGSANLTNKAMGTIPHHNLELLVEANASHPEIVHLLKLIDLTAVPATEEMAATIRHQAELFNQTNNTTIMVPGEEGRLAAWYPATRRPDRLYFAYLGKADAPPAVREGYTYDLAFLDVPPGLSETAFNETVRRRLRAIPEIRRLMNGERLTNLDIQASVMERASVSEREARRTTETIAEWLKHFDQFYIDVATWELRPGQEIT